MKAAASGQRTSVYLVRRAEALLGALEFFKAAGSDATNRRLQFLAQSDFWEWELENLIYSFTNLAERSRTWNSEEAARIKLGKLGIAVDAKLVQRVRWRSGQWRIDQRNQRVAPVDMLQQVIESWNELVSLAESQFIESMQAKAMKYGIHTVKDLTRLRKEMPKMAES